jgi:hypothetical protein
MAITVTKPVAAPTGLSATLQTGGSLDASTTYYYVVIAYSTNYLAPSAYTIQNYHSDLSVESSFTTTATELSALIKWTNVSGATNYEIFITKTSGDYSASFSQACGSQYLSSSITDGTTGYTVTTETGSIYVCHSAQYIGTLPGGLNKDLGIIKINFSGSDDHDFDDMIAAIDSAGLSDYYNWDGYTFVLKGWMVTDVGTTETGSFSTTGKNFVFVKGGLHARQQYFKFTFGTWLTAQNIPGQNSVCNLEFLNARYPFRAVYTDSEALNVYGGVISGSRADNYLSLSGGRNGGYYIGGSQLYIAGDVSGFKYCDFGLNLRGTAGTLRDVLFGQGNNFGNSPYIRCKCHRDANMPYKKGGAFYATEFLNPTDDLSFYGGSHVNNGYYTDFYDCIFPFTNGEINQGDFYYSSISAAQGLYSDCYVTIHYSLNVTIQDINGNPIQGVTVSAKNKNGEECTWTEHDGTSDKLAVATYTTPRTSDVNGQVDYYVKSYKISHNPENTGEGNSYNIIKTEEFPITFTFSKSGYESVQVVLARLNDQFSGIVTLNKSVPVMVGTDGRSAVKVNPKNIGANRDKIIMT